MKRMEGALVDVSKITIEMAGIDAPTLHHPDSKAVLHCSLDVEVARVALNAFHSVEETTYRRYAGNNLFDFRLIRLAIDWSERVRIN
jgi:hypothetical protein